MDGDCADATLRIGEISFWVLVGGGGIRRLEPRFSESYREADFQRELHGKRALIDGLSGMGRSQRHHTVSLGAYLEDIFNSRAPRCTPSFDITGLDPVECGVLLRTTEIPFGEVVSYMWLARCSSPGSSPRAVGRILSRNPAPVLIPCHRVIRSDGSLGGYKFGTEFKRFLLRCEGHRVRGCFKQRHQNKGAAATERG